jgi:ArsR family transcriptional regulator
MKKNGSLSPTQFQAVGRLFGVLSDPSRLSMLHLLKSGPMNVSELVEKTGMKQANVSKQLGLMFDLDLLSRQRVGNQVLYAIREPLIFQLCDLVCQKLQRDAQTQMELHKAVASR